MIAGLSSMAARKTPRQSRSRETVEAILTATADILARKGYAALTTNHIAERASLVRKPSSPSTPPNRRFIAP
jgi:AcrR family transcriptional regulator